MSESSVVDLDMILDEFNSYTNQVHDDIHIKISSKFIIITSNVSKSTIIILDLQPNMLGIELRFPNYNMMGFDLEVATHDISVYISNAKVTSMCIYGNIHFIDFLNCIFEGINFYGFVYSLRLSAVKVKTLVCLYVNRVMVTNYSSIKRYYSNITENILLLNLLIDDSMEIHCSNINIRGRRNQQIYHSVINQPSDIYYVNCGYITSVERMKSDILNYVVQRVI